MTHMSTNPLDQQILTFMQRQEEINEQSLIEDFVSGVVTELAVLKALYRLEAAGQLHLDHGNWKYGAGPNA